MHKLVPFKYLFDVCLEYEISKELLQFYIEISEEILGRKFAYPNVGSLTSISVEKGKADPFTIAKLFNEKISSDYSQFGDDLLNNTFLIDLSKGNKGSKLVYELLPNHILPKLKEASKDRESFDHPIFILLLETIYRESYYELLADYLKSGAICLVGIKQGHYLWKGDQFKEIRGYPTMIGKLKKDALSLLDFKLIKKVGHFERNTLSGDHLGCQQFLYDGQYCEEEIRELLKDAILDTFGDGRFNPTHLIFHAPTSPWFRHAIIKAANDVNAIRVKDGHSNPRIGCSEIDQLDPDKIVDQECKILFAVDFIHSGDTFESEYRETLKRIFPKSKVQGLTLLCSEYAVAHLKKEIKKNESIHEPNSISIPIAVEHIEIPVIYIKCVEEKIYVKEDETCPICRYGLFPKIVDSTDEGELMLTSYEMWLISNSAGYDNELVPQTHRKKRFLPNTMEMFKKNGPYLSLKFRQNLGTWFNNLPEKSVFVVFPDETTNFLLKGKLKKDLIKLEETPSGFFAKCLKELLGYEILGLPREIIHALKGEGEWEGNPIGLADIRTVFGPVFERIQSLPDDFVIVDEFYSTGNSIEKIVSILKHCRKKPPLYYFPVFNFGLKAMEGKCKSNEYLFSIQTLYELDLLIFDPDTVRI